MNEKNFRELVLNIYEAVTHPHLWPDVLDRVSQQVDARGCIVFEWRSRNGTRQLEAPLMTSNYSSDVLDAYIEKYWRWESEDQDLFERQSLSADGIELVNELDLYANESDYLAQPHVKEMLDYGIRHRFGGLLDKDNPYRARFAIQTGKRRGPLTPPDHETLGMILPHVAKALDLSGPLGVSGLEHRALLSIIERFNVGVCLLDSSGRVALTNTEFCRQRDDYKAFWTDSKDRLVLHDKADHKQYSRLLDDALNHGSFGARPRKEAILINSQDIAGSICVEIIPLEKSEEIGSNPFNGALLISRDTTQPIDIDVDLAKLAFNLTPTESAVTSLVCQGLTNSEIADKRERAIDTVNAQVKSILAKSSVANRTQLVRLLCNFSKPDKSEP